MIPEVERVGEGDRLRIAVLSDFDGPHARSWLRWFIARGHEVHAISFYRPRDPVDGAIMHALRRRDAPAPPASGGRGPATMAKLESSVPRGLVRLAHGVRYQQAGLGGVLRSIRPDVFQAHYVVEHGFYGALARVRPLVVTAWGSDVLVEPDADPISRLIAQWTIGRADLVTSNNSYMARRIGALGALPSRVAVITLGAERYDLELADRSVNRIEGTETSPVITSTRAHEPLYNVDTIIDAFRIVHESHPGARLIIANVGSLTPALQARARDIPAVMFAGMLDRAAFRDALAQAHVFVSTPSSDATSVALLQAMAAGAFPITADLPSQRELIEDGVNGAIVPVRDPRILAEAIAGAVADPLLRRTAAEHNRRLVEERGLNEVQMAKLEAHFYRLARRQTGSSIA